MKTSTVKKKRFRIVVALVVLVASVVVEVVAGMRLYTAQHTYQAAQSSYASLQQYVDQPVSGQSGGAGFPLTVDFTGLHDINPNITAWLYSPGTPINYPVLAATDYDYYLHHLPDGSENFLGSLFTDFNHPSDFGGNLSIIYGHHSQNNDMFAPLLGYENQEYYNTHPTMYLTTSSGDNYQVNILYGAHIRAGQWRDRAFMYEENLPSLLTYAKTNTTFTPNCKPASENQPNEDAIARGAHIETPAPTKYLVLSTCSYQFDNARYILIATLTPPGDPNAETCPT